MTTQASSKPRMKGEKGQSLVEVAITITIILMLLAGAFDLGSAYFYFIALRDAAQEGAVYGSLNPTDTAGIKNRIRQSSSEPIDFVNDIHVHEPNISIAGSPCVGGAITVTLEYDYQITMPLLGAILGGQTIPLEASVTNTILGPTCP